MVNSQARVGNRDDSNKKELFQFEVNVLQGLFNSLLASPVLIGIFVGRDMSVGLGGLQPSMAT